MTPTNLRSPMPNANGIVEYELVSAKHRKNLDIRNWEDEIRDAVQDVLPNTIVEVYKDYYRIIGKTSPTYGELTKIGKNIAGNPHIGKYVTTHEYVSQDGVAKVSNKLFIRKY